MSQSSALAPTGVVSSLQGVAVVIRQGERLSQRLNEGDVVEPGDVIVTTAETALRIVNADGQAFSPQDWRMADASANAGKAAQPAAGNRAPLSAEIDDVIGAIERGEDDAATAAGLTGGANGAAMGEGLRVDRVIEVVTPQEFSVISDEAEVEAIATRTGLSEDDEGELDVNDPPRFDDPGNPNFNPSTGNYSLVTDEDQPVSGQVKATDLDGDQLTFTKGADPAHGSVTVQPDGSWTYTPGANETSPVSFTIIVSDGKGGTATSTINVGITPVNDPPKFDDPGNPSHDPVTGNYKVTTDEDQPVSGQVKASDLDGDALTFTKGADPAHGSVTVKPDGSWTYTPGANETSPVSFTIIVSDGKGGTATSTINVGITPINDPPKFDDPGNPSYDPVTGNYKVTTDEDQPVSGQVKATDLDGDALTFTKGADPAHGSVTVKPDGSWTYTPGANETSPVSFTIIVSDGKGGTATSTINVGITPVNDPPKFDDPGNPNFNPSTGNYSLVTDEDQPVSGQVKATDLDGDQLTFTKGADPAHGSVTVKPDGSWTYTPGANETSPVSFTIIVSDGKGGTATSTINVGITPVNDPPKFDDPTNPSYEPVTGNYKVTTDEDQPVSGQVKATDLDGDQLTFTKGADPAHGSVTVKPDGSWTYTPGANETSPVSFTIIVSDGKGGTATSTINVGITPVNDPPKFDDPGNPSYDPVTGNYKVTTDEDQPVRGQVKATDLDGDQLTFTKGADPAHGSVTVKPDGSWTYTPGANETSPVSFTIIVSDGKGGTATSTINVGITPVNDAPTLNTGAGASLSEEGLLGGHPDSDGSTDSTDARQASGQVTFSDVEGQTVSLSLSGPTGLSSGGASITWSGQGTASSPLIGSAGGKTVLTATIGTDGRYQVELHAPIDHSDPAREDSRVINLQVSASDGQKTSSTTLAIRVEDDAPLSGAQVVAVQGQAASQNTNLMLILDTSGSMKDRLADLTVNGLKAAIKNLIDRYDALGDVHIQLVTFGSGAQGQSTWLSVNDAKNLINALTANGGTNYDAALAAARTAFQAPGKIPGGVNVSYFITDGVPTSGQGVTDGSDEVNWEGFLKANDIDSFAIGTGSLTSAQINNIQPIAYNGITETEKPAVTLATNAELGSYLLDTVPVIQKGTLAGLAGADGLKSIDSVSAVGQLGSSLDASGKVLTLQLKSGGTLQINLQTGDFTLSQPKGAAAESFAYSVTDRDGDRGTGTFTLSATNAAPAGTDTSVTIAEDGRHTFSPADFGFRDGDLGDTLAAVRIDSLPAAGRLTLNGSPVTTGQVIQASSINQLSFTPETHAHGQAYARIAFTVQDSRGQFDPAPNQLTVHVTPVNDAPQAFASNSGHNLLGLIDLSVSPLLNLSRSQQVAVNDIDNNLTRVEVRVDALLSLGSLLGDRSALSVSTDAALTQGLMVTGNDSRHLVIESVHAGQTLDITQVNKLLATLQYDPADILGVSADLFPSMTITAVDAAGARDTASVSSSIVAIGVDVAPLVNTVESVVAGAGEHTAQLGTEVFQWTLADRPATGERCIDVIHGFDGASRSAGGDVLDLRDLLSGEHASSLNGQVDVGNLLAHLDFDTQSQPGSTVIHVSASGGFLADGSGNSASAGCQDQQQIVLSNVDIRASLGLDAQASDHQIIAELMQRGKLLVDHS